MSKFQIIVLGFFVFAIIGGTAAFALYRGGDTSTLPEITIWGTFPQNDFNSYVGNLNRGSSNPLKIVYTQFEPNSFSNAFVRALANGEGPDAILISADMLLPQVNKLMPIPYTALSRRDYIQSYVQEGELYLSDDGMLAVPLAIDPLVMYWNRDIFNAAGLATHPSYWSDFVGTKTKPALVQRLTSKDANGNLRKSALALGEFSNITNAREILGSLFLQSGNRVSALGDNSQVVSTLVLDRSIVPAIEFFSQFVNPVIDNYAWNKAMPNDKVAFLSGNLATYFGFASELHELVSKNPNLNFDVAPLPQLRDGKKAVYAKMYGLSIVRTSANANAAYEVISRLTDPANVRNLSDAMYLPSVRREVIAQGSDDPYITVFDEQALIGQSWLDAGPVVSGKILANLVQSVTNGQSTVAEAIRLANDLYDYELRQAYRN